MRFAVQPTEAAMMLGADSALCESEEDPSIRVLLVQRTSLQHHQALQKSHLALHLIVSFHVFSIFVLDYSGLRNQRSPALLAPLPQLLEFQLVQS